MPRAPRPEPRKLPQQQRSRALYDAILTAAADLLENVGPELTLSEVATRAGVSSGSLYQYFPDRPALIAALIDRQLAHDRDTLRQLREAEVGKESLPQLLVDGLLGLYGSRPRSMVHMVTLLRELGRDADVQQLTEEFCDSLAQRLHDEQPALSTATCRDAARSAVFALLGVVRQVALDTPARLASDPNLRARLLAIASAALPAAPAPAQP